MTYTGRDQDRVYSGENADITYSLRRCIHAKECVNRLSTVFNLDQRPWIQVGATNGDVLADTVERCPSGALHHFRKDGGAAEATPQANRITLWPNGPIQVSGDLRITAAGVDIADETRATLCRCGASQNKPFCDNSHLKTGYSAAPASSERAEAGPIIEGGTLHIDAAANGPLRITGNVRILEADGTEIFAGDTVALCRCGSSANKPFCDGTHLTYGFQAE
jgi:CDGSH-type Zn-finger protein/uncharacterized Fe-S cluster protein YjdI